MNRRLCVDRKDARSGEDLRQACPSVEGTMGDRILVAGRHSNGSCRYGLIFFCSALAMGPRRILPRVTLRGGVMARSVANPACTTITAPTYA